MRLLLIEPDDTIAASIELMLRGERYHVYRTDYGAEAIDLSRLYVYDLILLEMALPDTPGIEVIRSLRAGGNKTPILVVSRLDGIEEKVRALDLGADDYLTKPFHRDELIARIQSLVRRSVGHAASLIEIGNLSINISSKTAEVDTAQIALTGKEWQILEILALQKGQTLTKERIFGQMYGDLDDEPEIKIVDVFICKLRAKLRRAGVDAEINTVWGRGYRLIPAGASAAEDVATAVGAAA